MILIDGKGCAVGIIEGPADWASPETFRLIEAALGAWSSNSDAHGILRLDTGLKLDLVPSALLSCVERAVGGIEHVLQRLLWLRDGDTSAQRRLDALALDPFRFLCERRPDALDDDIRVVGWMDHLQ